MGVLYLFGRDGKVFSPSKFWDNVNFHSAGGAHGAQLSFLRHLAVVLIIVLVGATGFYFLEGQECTPGTPRTLFRSASPPVCGPKVSPSDAAYFTIITLTTIGYGDVSPSTPSSRLWVVAVALAGMSVMSTLLDELGVWRLALSRRARAGGGGRQGLEWAACLLAVLGGGAAMFGAAEGMPLGDGLYLALATSTTIGYGDLRPETPLGKALTAGYALLVVSVFGYITSCVGDAIQPDSDTSIGFGGEEAQWGLSVVDKLLGRSLHDPSHYSLSRNNSLKVSLVCKVFLLVLLSSAITLQLDPSLTPIDALYFVVMTLTTVGFGDIVAVTARARAFEVVLALLGLGLFSSFTDLVGEWRALVPPPKGASAKLATAAQCAATLAATLGIGTFAFAAAEGLGWADALYLSAMTATTIGYGDVHPATDEGKLVACAFACLAVSAVGFVTSSVGDWLQDSLCAVWEGEKEA